jgi:hypothetical protein
VWIEPGLAARHGEEITPHTRRQRLSPVSAGPSGSNPVLCQSITASRYSTTISEPVLRLIKNRLCRISETEAANHHIQPLALTDPNSEVRQRDLRGREQIRHQMLFAELDLKHIDTEPRLTPPPQADRADRRRAVVKFFEQSAHRVTTPLRRVVSAGTAGAFALCLSAL